jgi:DNA-binding response OmpR family regulator
MQTRKILLADDDESVRRMVGRVLESEDYEVLLACNAEEAIKRTLTGAPDLVLLDLNMPGKDGWAAFELIDRIRPFVPVIVITARPNQYGYATQVGVDALMEKPLDLAILLTTIRDLLAESERDRVKRLTDRSFTTACLSPAAGGQPAGKA